MKDKQGREYLKLDNAKAGMVVELDDGFTCHAAGKVTLEEDETGIYFTCKENHHVEENHHYIDGQADDGVYCIGIYP